MERRLRNTLLALRGRLQYNKNTREAAQTVVNEYELDKSLPNAMQEAFASRITPSIH
jgi:hypothetical protein